MKKILVADDDESMRGMLASFFRFMGMGDCIIFAVDGKDALALYRNHEKEIGLIITDQQMPKMEGHQFVGEVRSLGYTGKIILMSGTLAEDIALSCGADAFLKKPFTGKVFMSAIEGNFIQDEEPPKQ